MCSEKEGMTLPQTENINENDFKEYIKSLI